MQRRRSFPAARFSPARRKPHWMWIRSQANSVSPIIAPAFNTADLLLNYRTLAGIDLNLPEFTIWRFRIKVSIKFNVTAATLESNSGVTVAAFVDNMAATFTNPVAAVFDERYLIWDTIFAFSALQQGANGGDVLNATNLAMYKEYDVKSHRKLGNIGETLLFQIAPLGTGEVLNYSYQQSTLVLLRS